MLTNKQIAEFIFFRLKKNGFAPKNIIYEDGYFIFNKGENSVVKFKIKHLWNNWLFGMWINEENMNNGDPNDNVVSIFCQYEKTIDKFKPSASSLCVELSRTDIEHEMKGIGNYFFQLKDLIHMVKRHPFISYYVDSHWGKFFPDYFLLEFFRYESDRVLREINNIICHWITNKYLTRSKRIFLKKFKTQKAELIDGNKNGFKSYPRYTLRLELTNRSFLKIFDDNTNKIFPNSIFYKIIRKNSTVYVFVEEEDGKFSRYFL